MFQHAEPKRANHEMTNEELEQNVKRLRRSLNESTLDRNQRKQYRTWIDEYDQELEDRDDMLLSSSDEEDNQYDDEGSDISKWSIPRKNHEIQELRKRLKALKSKIITNITEPKYRSYNHHIQNQIQHIRLKIKEIIFSRDDDEDDDEHEINTLNRNHAMILLCTSNDIIRKQYNDRQPTKTPTFPNAFDSLRARETVAGGVKPLSIVDMRTEMFLDLAGQGKDTGRDQNRQNIFHYMAAKPILDFTHEDIKAYFDQKQDWLSQYDNKGQTPLDLLLHVNKKPPYNMLVLFEKGPRFQTLFKQAIRSNKISRTMSMSCRLEHWLEFNDEETKQRNIDVFIQNNTYDKVMIAFFIDQCAKMNPMFKLDNGALDNIKPLIEIIMLQQFETSEYKYIANLLFIVYKATRRRIEYQDHLQNFKAYYDKMQHAPYNIERLTNQAFSFSIL